MAAALECVRRNELALNTRYTLIVVTAIMLEGIQRKLDPGMDIHSKLESVLSSLEYVNAHPAVARWVDWWAGGSFKV